ncbi:hypothetical protein BGZ80_010773 [Entomortierella chlamydospora]|uniref:Acid phosphatase n=1 Tax=Entomortierella chlamydospora TaxID=101097 RepID=A0A9P6SZI2_9FUNG|nr:hypothetical protein BGZ80_010773 [Entomortierella chlamydospora]
MLFKKFASLTLLAATAFAQAPKGAAFDHIVIIFLENTDYALASTDSYFQALIPQGILLDNYHGLAHPSQPNYIASIGGSTHSVTSDSTYNLSPSYSTIVDLLEAKQLTWKTYQENIPSVCYTGSSSSSLYYRKHNPFVSYGSIYKNSTRCKNVVSATQFTTDVNNGALPNYSFYTPNIKNDGHDTTVAYAGQWLTGFLTPLLSNSNFMKNTLVVVTFDEAEDYSDTTNHVLALLLGDAVNGTANTVDSTYYTHYSLISTVENNWGLGNLNLGDVGQLGNVFNLVASKTGYQNVAVTNPPPLNN